VILGDRTKRSFGALVEKISVANLKSRRAPITREPHEDVWYHVTSNNSAGRTAWTPGEKFLRWKELALRNLRKSELSCTKLTFAVRFLFHRGPFHAVLANRARAFLSTG
jgi:hypothetical protein